MTANTPDTVTEVVASRLSGEHIGTQVSIGGEINGRLTHLVVDEDVYRVGVTVVPAGDGEDFVGNLLPDEPVLLADALAAPAAPAAPAGAGSGPADDVVVAVASWYASGTPEQWQVDNAREALAAAGVGSGPVDEAAVADLLCRADREWFHADGRPGGVFVGKYAFMASRVAAAGVQGSGEPVAWALLHNDGGYIEASLLEDQVREDAAVIGGTVVPLFAAPPAGVVQTAPTLPDVAGLEGAARGHVHRPDLLGNAPAAKGCAECDPDGDGNCERDCLAAPATPTDGVMQAVIDLWDGSRDDVIPDGETFIEFRTRVEPILTALVGGDA